MSGNDTSAKGRRPNKYLCSTPARFCTGNECMDAEVTKSKYHDGKKQAQKCEQRYMVKQGYTRLSPRDFAPPDGGPVVVISKRSGHQRVKPGKTEGGFMAMPCKVRDRLPEPPKAPVVA